MPKKLRSLTAAQKQRAYRLTSANDRVSENASRDGAYATFSSDELLRAAERSTTNEELQQLSKLIGERATIRLRAQMLIDQYAGDLVAAQYEAMRMRELQSPSSFAHTEWRGIVNMIRYARIVRRQLT